MNLGLTQQTKENKRISLLKRLFAINTVFGFICLLPLIIWLLFKLDLIPSTPVFSTEIQQAVGKVITPNSTGTAFLISPTQMLTARHVVENQKVGETVQVVFEKSEIPKNFTATIKFIASSTITAQSGAAVPLDYFLSDVALLEISEGDSKDIEPLILGESASVADLDEVILIGYPKGDYSITKGNINSQSFQKLDLFKLDAESNPGNSGGPCILKSDNSVIGILVGGGVPGVQGENVAIKVDNVRRLLQAANVKL